MTAAYFVSVFFQHGYAPGFYAQSRTAEDVVVYIEGARGLWNSPNLYLEEINIAEDTQLPFSYPPTALLFFQPLALLSWGHGWFVVNAISVACLWWIIVLTLRRFASPHPLAWASLLMPIALCVDSVHNTLYHGQINLILLALVLTDLWLDSPRIRKVLPRGVLIGIAACVKMIPALFILYFALRREIKPILVMVTTAFASFAIVGLIKFELVRYYFSTQLGKMTETLGQNRSHNLSLHSVGARYVPESTRSFATCLLITAVLVIAIAAFVRLQRAGATEAAGVAIGYLGLMLAPISWQHHFVWEVPLLIILGICTWRRAEPRLLALLLAWLSVTTVFIPHRHFPDALSANPEGYTLVHLAQSSVLVLSIVTLIALCYFAPQLVASTEPHPQTEATPTPAEA